MNLIHPRVEALDWLGQTPVMDRLEICGRTAYKSEERIVAGSADKFVASILKRGHLSVLEHHRFFLKWKWPNRHEDDAEYDHFLWDSVITASAVLFDHFEGLVTECSNDGLWVSLNARTLIEACTTPLHGSNPLSAAILHRVRPLWPTLFGHIPDLPGLHTDWSDPLRVVEPSEIVASLPPHLAARLLPATLRFVVDRGISHELVRHRKMSPTQESTRYCDYGKHGVTFVIPPWVNCTAGAYDLDKDLRALTNLTQGLLQADDQWVTMAATSELQYRALRENGWTPQQARTALAHSVKTEVCVTGTLERWHTLLTLRVANDVHPQMAEVSVPTLRWFQQQPVFGPYFADIQVGDKWRDLRVAKVLAGAGEGEA